MVCMCTNMALVTMHYLPSLFSKMQLQPLYATFLLVCNLVAMSTSLHTLKFTNKSGITKLSTLSFTKHQKITLFKTYYDLQNTVTSLFKCCLLCDNSLINK
jgi:hypothetical protein